MCLFLLVSSILLAGNSYDLQIENRSDSEVILNLSIDDVNFTNTRSENVQYQEINFDSEQFTTEIGLPRIPILNKLIQIPDQGTPEFRITNLETRVYKNINIIPFQGYNDEIEPLSLTKNTNFYTTNSKFPQSFVQISDPAIMRDLRLATISLRPFSYNAASKELTVATRMSVEVVTSGNNGINQKVSRSINRSSRFESIYQSAIVNYTPDNSRELPAQPIYLFIYPDSDDQVETNLSYLWEWKRKKGFIVNTAGTSVTGTSKSAIKSYIQGQYDSAERPDFIVLCGDANGSYTIPTDMIDGGEGDHYYTCLEGNDLLADTSIGRLSFENVSQLTTIVAKIMSYEMNPYMAETDWYQTAFLLGDTSSSGQTTIDSNLYIKGLLNNYFPHYTVNENYSGNYSNSISNQFNNGISLFNYRGFAGMSGFYENNIWNLTNSNKLPFAVFLTCGTGTFSGTSRSEAFLRHGTPTSPKGAIAAIGTSTLHTHTTFNNSVCSGIFLGLIQENITNPGYAVLRGKLNLFECFYWNPDNKLKEFSYWNNLMGDPGLDLWTAIPSDMNVSYPSDISTGTNFITVNVTDDSSQPIENAWVTLYDANSATNISAYTNAAGEAVVEVPSGVTSTCSLTVTSHNFKPFMTELTLEQQDEGIFVETYTIDDSDNNNLANTNETLTFDISYKNYGSNAASDVEVELSCEVPGVNITTANATIGDIASGSNSTNDDLVAEIEYGIGGTTLPFKLEITNNAGSEFIDYIMVPLNGGNIEINDFIFSGQEFIMPATTDDIIFDMQNVGQLAMSNVQIELQTNSPFITLIDSISTISSINADEEFTNSADPFEIEVASTLVPGMQIPVDFVVSSDDGTQQTIRKILPTSSTSDNLPTGPDNYGYIIFDSNDEGYASSVEYDWIEISDIGTNLNLNDTGDEGMNATVHLPFNFRFYGQSYDSVTVCTNGWIAPGGTEIRDYMNWHLPGPLGPSPIIAAFWDDLATASGDVYSYYSTTEHAMIIQWDDMDNVYSNAEETFQAILYDPMYRPTSTGDSEIKLQYKVVNNDDQGDYASYHVDHGLYGTVGIESPDGRDGIEYTCNDEYSIGATELVDGLALLITGTPIAENAPVLILNEATFIDEDNSNTIDAGETAFIDVKFSNYGMSNAIDVTGTITTNNPHVTIVEGLVNYSNIESQNFAIADDHFVISISDELEIQETVEFNIQMQNADINIGFPFTLEIYPKKAQIEETFIYDTDYTLSQDESSKLVVLLKNAGFSNLNDATLTVTTSNNNVEIAQSEMYLGTIIGLKTYSCVIPISANSEAEGNVPLAITLEFDGQTITFNQQITIGSVTTSNAYGRTNGSFDSTGDDVVLKEAQLIYENYMGSPNDNGIYEVVLPSGNYDATYKLIGHLDDTYEIQLQEFSSITHIVELTQIPFVEDVSLTDNGDGTIEITWDEVEYDNSEWNFMSYVIYRKHNDTPFEEVSETTTTTFDDDIIENEEYFYYVVAEFDEGISAPSNQVSVNSTFNTDAPEIAKTALLGSYPNPFTASNGRAVTNISFSLHKSSNVNLSIYNVKGQKVKTIADGKMEQGKHTIQWNGKDVNGKETAAGVYFYRLSTPEVKQCKKMLKIK
jgi:hypothetical protein